MDSSMIEAFDAKTSPAFKAIVRRLIQVINDSGHPLAMDIKWGQLTFAHHADFHHWICAIKITRKWVGLIFHFGGLLNDPGAVFKIGTSKFVRTLQYQTVEEIDEILVQGFINQALARLPFFIAHWKEIQKGDPS